MARPGESGAAIGPKTTTPPSEATGPPDNPCGSGLPKQAVAADEWQATTEIHRAFCRYLFCRACGIAFCGNVEAVEAEDAQDSIREDFQELPILGRDRGCHPNPPLCHHVPDRPQRRVAGARPVAVAANEPGCLRISMLICRSPFLSWLWRRSGRPTASRNTHPGWTSESTEAHEGGIRPTVNAGPMADGASRMIDGAAVHVSSAQRGSRIGGEDAAHSPPPSNEKVLDGSPGYHYEDIQPFGRCFQLRLDGTPESRCAGRTGEAAVITGEGTQSASTTPTRPSIHT